MRHSLLDLGVHTHTMFLYNYTFLMTYSLREWFQID